MKPNSQLKSGWYRAERTGGPGRLLHYSTGRGFACGAARPLGRPELVYLDNELMKYEKCRGCELAIERAEAAAPKVGDDVFVMYSRTCYNDRPGRVRAVLPGNKFAVLMPARTRRRLGPTGKAGWCTDAREIKVFHRNNLDKVVEPTAAEFVAAGLAQLGTLHPFEFDDAEFENMMRRGHYVRDFEARKFDEPRFVNVSIWNRKRREETFVRLGYRYNELARTWHLSDFRDLLDRRVPGANQCEPLVEALGRKQLVGLNMTPQAQYYLTAETRDEVRVIVPPLELKVVSLRDVMPCPGELVPRPHLVTFHRDSESLDGWRLASIKPY
jgi:hypothetical protein